MFCCFSIVLVYCIQYIKDIYQLFEVVPHQFADDTHVLLHGPAASYLSFTKGFNLFGCLTLLLPLSAEFWHRLILVLLILVSGLPNPALLPLVNWEFFNPNLIFTNHFNSVSRPCFYHLLQLCSTRKLLVNNLFSTNHCKRFLTFY